VSTIGVLREGPLHAAVKAMLAGPGDRLEVPVGRFVIDMVRADGELVEVQTGGFGPLGAKLDALLDRHTSGSCTPSPSSGASCASTSTGRWYRAGGRPSGERWRRCSTS
jgi:hypothetical protein